MYFRSQKTPVRLGFSTWGFEGDLVEAASIISKYFPVVEVFVRSLSHLNKIDVYGLKKLSVSYSVHAPEQASLTLPDEDELKKSIKALQASIELAYVLDSDIVVFHSGRNYGEGSFERLVYALKKCCSTAESYGVYLCLENGWGRGLVHTLEQIRRVLDEVGSDYLKATLDTGHCFIAGIDPLKEYENNYDIVFEIHLHSNYGNSDDHLLPHVGLLDLEGLVDILQGKMFNRYVVLEVKTGKNPEEFIAYAKEELERYFV
ncbi:MAG: hypothetical protein DRJ52_04920 [Thermoprotei archaeon]|nr:MAG: hypothetical protein DRJ52_04920 [Thermoprotei archaeon]